MFLLLLDLGGCARGPVISREILADPAMRFDRGRPIDAPGMREPQPSDPLPPNTVAMQVRFASEPGAAVEGSWFDSSLRAAVEIWAGIGLEAGYGFVLDQEREQKLDGFTGPVGIERTRHGPDAAVVLDDGTSTLRAGYRFRTGWDGDLHEPSVTARTSVLRRDTVVEVGYRRSMATVTVPADRLPARQPVDEDVTRDALHAAVEQGFLPGWNVRLEAAIHLEEGFLHNPFRLVSLWAQRPSSSEPFAGVPRVEEEHHPGSRFRWGALLRVRKALPALASVIELGAGHGSGSWRVEHTSAQVAYTQRIGDPVSLTLRGGAYHQTRASFYRDDYPDGPPGAFWSADRALSSYLAYWAEACLSWTHLPQRGRALGIFKYLTLEANFRWVLADYLWEGPGSDNGFSSYSSLVTPPGTADSGREKFEGGMVLGGWLTLEGGF